jgi:hypothetical protein
MEKLKHGYEAAHSADLERMLTHVFSSSTHNITQSTETSNSSYRIHCSSETPRLIRQLLLQRKLTEWKGYAVEELHYKPEGRGIDSRWGPSGCIMALGSIHPLTEVSTRGIS